MTCDDCRAVLVGTWSPGAAMPPEAVAHLDACAACREWGRAYGDGLTLSGADPDALSAEILTRTSGPGCGRARELMAGRADGPLGALDTDLLAVHLEHCPACAAFASVLDGLPAVLPGLAELGPGPGFTERVLDRTSLKPRWADRWRAFWGRLVRRPRFAWEVAYAMTIGWLVFFGPTVTALEWTGNVVTTVVREHAPSQIDAIGQTLGSWLAAIDPERPAAELPAGEHGGSWTASAVAAWKSGVDWTGRMAAAILDSLEAAFRATVEWFAEFFGRLSPPPSEPPAAAPRSPE